MPSVQIKDVPEQTHRVLTARAAAANQSLQQYLRSRLIDEASRPSLDEVLAETERTATGTFSFDDVNELLRADRDRR